MRDPAHELLKLPSERLVTEFGGKGRETLEDDGPGFFLDGGLKVGRAQDEVTEPRRNGLDAAHHFGLIERGQDIYRGLYGDRRVTGCRNGGYIFCSKDSRPQPQAKSGVEGERVLTLIRALVGG